MFFSGDSLTRKRVDLGGRSSKERDRHKLVEQTRLERNRRLFQRQQNSSAIKIQKCFRAWRAVQAEHHKVREQFFIAYGKRCENVSRECFGPTSKFLCELLFFFNPKNEDDLFALLETCRLLLQYAQDTGDAISLFAGMDYSLNHGLVDYRVKRLTYACILAVHVNRNQVKKQPFYLQPNSSLAKVLLDAVIKLIDPVLPWTCEIVPYLMRRNTFTLFREIILSAEERVKTQSMVDITSLEHVLTLIIPHNGKKPCVCQSGNQWWSFISHILTIPFLWLIFPGLKKTFSKQPLCEHYVHQIALHVHSRSDILHKDVSTEYPSYACLLGNILEAAASALCEVDSTFEMAVDLTTVATFLFEMLPPLQSSDKETKERLESTMEDEEMIPVEEYNGNILSRDLESQIVTAIDARFLLQLTNALFGGIASANTCKDSPDEREVIAIGAACAFLHVKFNTLPLEHMMTILAYGTTLVPVLWKFMKRSHETQTWQLLSEKSSYLPEGAPGWLLPLAVFCPIYKQMLMIIDNEEFYEQEKPLALKDIRCLIVILRQALWQLLWGNPVIFSKFSADSMACKKQPSEFLQYRVSVVSAELLTQLQDWNNRRQFAPPSDFHADGANESFITQSMLENTRAYEIIKQAPFLVPFPCRVKIFASQLAAARIRDNSHAVFSRNRLKIRRDHILEDAFDQLSALSEDDLKGSIRVAFINELGVEEAGIDGGGIFKDFMENVSRAAFDIQYGLFKETSDHLLYPNPGSRLVHEQHLQFFHFLGTILAKAMFEGILVDIPFATFFLSKLKQKHNYLNDLPSLDPELYRHLLFLKRYQGDISDLELYFVIVNNEYGEQTEEELVAGGKNMRVTNENVIPYIHLIANYRLNFQIRQQSSHFLRGFQQLIRKDWIDMFNEHELQVLISGSLDGLDIDDLRSHTQYSGGYHAEPSSSHYKHPSQVAEFGSQVAESDKFAGTVEKKRWNILALVLKATVMFRESYTLEKMKLHCCLFPDGYEFERGTFVQLCMAAGYLTKGRMEDTGNKYFDILLDEGYILSSKFDYLTGNKYRVNLNMVVKGFGERFARRNEDLYIVLKDDRIKCEGLNPKHVTVMSNMISLKTLETFNNLRTLLFPRNYGYSLSEVPSAFFLALGSLETLDLSGTHITELPGSIGNARQLRYLDVSFTLIESLPEDIDRLQELQTLKLIECRQLHCLPKGMEKLKTLRHLYFDVLGQLNSMPRGMGSLTELRTLSAFIVATAPGGCNIGDLRNMINLSGSCCISGLEIMSDGGFIEPVLQNKSNLTHVELRWNDYGAAIDEEHVSSSMSYLEPHPHIEDLKVVCYPSSALPTWIGEEKFKHLTSITFLNFKNSKLDICLGQLPNLKCLDIFQMNNVEKIDGSIHSVHLHPSFPKLEKLTIEGMLKLESWTGVESGYFPLLSEFRIKYCPSINVLHFIPYLTSLKHLEIRDCPKLGSLFIAPDIESQSGAHNLDAQSEECNQLPAKLETLIVDDCPLLMERYSKGGEHWYKIQHVPDIWFDLEDMHSLSFDDDGHYQSGTESYDENGEDTETGEDSDIGEAEVDALELTNGQ